VGLTNLPCKKKIVEKPPRNSAGFCGGGQGLSWAVEPRKEEDELLCLGMWKLSSYFHKLVGSRKTVKVKVKLFLCATSYC
jgi:hypothetical protein